MLGNVFSTNIAFFPRSLGSVDAEFAIESNIVDISDFVLFSAGLAGIAFQVSLFSCNTDSFKSLEVLQSRHDQQIFNFFQSLTGWKSSSCHTGSCKSDHTNPRGPRWRGSRAFAVLRCRSCQS